MGKKFLTVMLVPSMTSKVRKYRIPQYVINALTTFLIVLTIISAFLTYDYFSAKKEVAELDELRKETVAQRLQINTFASNIINLEKEMLRLQKFDRKLRLMTDLNRDYYNFDEQAFGVGGPDGRQLTNLSEALEMKQEELTREMEKDLKHLSTDLANQEESFCELCNFLEDQRSLLISTPSIWPVKGWVTSGFGYRRDPFTGRKTMHDGIDVAARMNTPIVAPADGLVTYVGVDRGFGKVMIIDHGYGFSTRYGHNARINVKTGQKVKRGQIVSYLGSTGRSTGPHLHYEVRRNGVPENPQNYILN